MPVLNSSGDAQYEPRISAQPQLMAETAPRRARAFPVCANPRCASGWLQLWRKRGVPVVEGGWLCSPACTRARVEDLLRREQAEARPAPPHRHRVPIGLTLLTQGWITHQDLKDALEAQRKGSRLRLGEWLVAHRGLKEEQLTQALGLQWSCPVFSLEKQAGSLPANIVPRLFSESFGFVPLRLTASGRLYLAFEDRIDHSLALAMERMVGLQVVAGLLGATEFREAQRLFAQGHFARARLIEAGNPELLAEAFSRQIEKEKPAEARLVRVHDLVWLRLWRDMESRDHAQAAVSGIEDVIGSVVRFP